MGRIYIVMILAFIGWIVWRWLQKLPPEKRRATTINIAIWGTLGLFLILAATGRLHWIAALFAGLVAVMRPLSSILFRVFPLLQSWLKSRGSHRASGQQHNPGTRTTIADLDEAYAVLGLTPGATRQDIIDAHKSLIQKLHPDRGGNDYLAAKLNAAKDALLDHIRH
ncbi:MAG: DnaJ domain-containing protein [bacterium]